MLGLGSIASKLFGTSNDRKLKVYRDKVDAINALEPELEKLKSELGSNNIEDVLSYALFPHVARAYFDERDGRSIDDTEVTAIAVALATKFLKDERKPKPLRSRPKPFQQLSWALWHHTTSLRKWILMQGQPYLCPRVWISK